MNQKPENNQDEKLTYDIVVIGGGISGIGIALEAAKAGFDVAVFEKNKLFNAASSNNLRIIHGGFRYLQSLDFKRLLESFRARRELMEKYPEFIKALPCLMPLKTFGLKSFFPISIANFIFNTIARFDGQKDLLNKIYSKKELLELLPDTKEIFKCGALCWYDAHIDDLEGFHSKLLLDAKNLGAKFYEQHEVLDVYTEGKRLGVLVRSKSESKKITAKVVVNASGAWLKKINNRVDLKTENVPPLWSKAFNVVLRKKIFDKYALGLEARDETGKKRLFFVTPRSDGNAIGTEYLLYDGAPENMKISEEEVERFIQHFNQISGLEKISSGDIKAIESGVLPVKSKTGDVFKLYGSELILNRGSYFEILSTKYTTFLPQARNLLKRASTFLH